MKVLYVNACVREESRTNLLAKKVLEKYGVYEEIRLNDVNMEPLRRDTLEKRTERINQHDFSTEMFQYAKQFAEADIIVMAAPYWDLSFPAVLKIYLENIYITGIVSQYGADGRPEGLCQGKLLYYVTTAGGPFESKYSYDYIYDLAVNYFGINDAKLVAAEMLDIQGCDADAIMKDALRNIEEMF